MTVIPRSTRCRTAVSTAAAAFLLTAVLAGQTTRVTGGKLPIPRSDQRAKAARRVEELLSFPGVKALPRPADKAAHYLAASWDAAEDEALRFFLLEQAQGLAVSGFDDALAFAALERRSARFDLGAEAPRLPLRLGASLVKGRKDPQLQNRLAAHYGMHADAAAATDDLTTALLYAEAASKAAVAGEIAEVVAEARARVLGLREIAAALPVFRAAAAVLEKRPADAEANRTAGRYLCFYKRRWTLGLSHLARGGEGAAARQARSDRQEGLPPEALLAVAEGWRALADDERGVVRSALLRRADATMRRVAPQLKGLTAAKAADMAKSYATAAAGSGYVLAGDGVDTPTCLLPARGFHLTMHHAERATYRVAVPPLARGKGRLEIKVGNMGDNKGDGKMECELLDRDGKSVFRRHGGGDPGVFNHEVAGDTWWTIVLIDEDARGDGNKGSVEATLFPH